MYTFEFINKFTQFGKDNYSMIIYFDGLEVLREEVSFAFGTAQDSLDVYANSKIDFLVGE